MRLLSSAPLSTLLILTPALTSAFYLPGVAPTSYSTGDKVPLHVNRLTPAFSAQDEQIHSAFAFDYYYPAFMFCRPQGGPKDVRESLGSIIFGDRIQTSPFELQMAKNETCKPLCEKKYDPRKAKFVNRKIWQAFNINWLVDGLPAAQRVEDPMTNAIYYSPGFFLGGVDQSGQAFMNNHYDIIVEYHRAGMRGNQFRVVGVTVNPRSVKDSKILGDNNADCGTAESPKVILDDKGETAVTFTYGVHWKESSTTWATRWDNYLHVLDPKIHWFSLVNSTIFVVFLMGMVGMILLRALRKDIARYNRLDAFNLDDLSGTSAAVEDGVQEDSGWKLVHGDVFRCPKHPLILAVFLGNGAQLFVMTGLTVGAFSNI